MPNLLTESAEHRSALPPGPRLPALAQALRYTFDQPRFFAEARRRYGSTWTLRLPGFPPAVITTDRDAIKALFTGDPLTKRHGNDLLRPLLGDRSILLLEPEEHLQRRRLELPSFHGDAVRRYTERIRERFEAEVAGWPRGEVVPVHRRTRPLTLGVILELILGIDDQHLKSELAAILDGFNTPINNLGQFMPERVVYSRLNLPGRIIFRRLDHLRELLRAHISNTRSDAGERDDVLALLVRARDEDGSGFSDADLEDELFTLVLAGHETTATAMAWACDLLAHNPRVQARLRETLAGGERDYLKATTKEMLRARTVAYVSAGRTPLEPITIGKWEIGAEAVVLIDAQGLHGDPDLHPDPEEFRPERFLGEGPDSYSYLPFGGGAHRCLGAALAMLELELMTEAVALGAALEPAGPPAKPVRRGITLAPSGEAPVRVA